MAKPYLQNALLNKLHEMNLTPTEFERRAGLARASVSKLIGGTSTNPTLDTLSAIAKAFNCGIDELVGQRVRDTTSEPNIIEICQTLPWNSTLFSKVTNSTCSYLEKADKNPTLEQILKAIIEIYNYCIQKKDGIFDNSFHEWYMQKLLEKLDV